MFTYATSYNLNNCPGVFLYEGTDNRKNANKRLKNGTWTTPVKYTLNSYGYRCLEFEDIDWDNSILTFGCSHTFGLGVDDTDTWPYQLSKILDYPVVNLGTPGAALWSLVPNIKTIAESFNPKCVILQVPESNRIANFSKNNYTKTIGPWFKPGSKEYVYWSERNRWPSNAEKWEEFGIDYINKLLPKGIDCSFSLSTSTNVDFTIKEKLDYARDNKHRGPKTNQEIAKKVAKHLLDNNLF